MALVVERSVDANRDFHSIHDEAMFLRILVSMVVW
jgi:hypothetical protein